MKPNSAIQKGKLLENWLADKIVALGLDSKACRSAGSGNGNREKSDINTSLTILGRNAGFECKNHRTLAIPAWWRQVEKLEQLGREPVLAFKLPQEGLEATKVVIYADTLLKLLKQAKNANGEVLQDTASPDKQRELKWALERARTEIDRLRKLL
jgi:hypothetical protein